MAPPAALGSGRRRLFTGLAEVFPDLAVLGTRAMWVVVLCLEGPPLHARFGPIDADRGVGELDVAIRTFWLEGGELHLGTGAGVVGQSRPEAEWDETELEARRLLEAAAGTVAA